MDKESTILERLKVREEKRQKEIEKKKEQNAECIDENQTVSAYLYKFHSYISQIREIIKQSTTIKETGTMPVLEQKHHFNQVYTILDDAKLLLSDSMIFLPSYDVQQTKKSLKDLEEEISTTFNILFPKKSFSFRSRQKMTVKKEEKQNNHETMNIPTQGTSFKVQDKELAFRNVKNETLTKYVSADSESTDFVLSNLEHCKVFIHCPMTALRIDRLNNCQIFCSPVNGSIFMDKCTGCTFCIASRQLRIHHTKDCDYYVFVKSNPIIEDTTHVRFAPYSYNYSQRESDFARCDFFMEKNMFDQVNDFNWLKQIASPNWTVIPLEQRKSFKQ